MLPEWKLNDDNIVKLKDIIPQIHLPFSRKIVPCYVEDGEKVYMGLVSY